MDFPLKNIIIIICILGCIGCANKDKKNEISTENDEGLNFPEQDYVDAKILLDNEEYNEAIIAFQDIEKKYPLSNWALKSKLMIIFIYYVLMDYENAEDSANRFINKYPDYKDIDYAYYLRAQIVYEQIKNSALDISYAEKSLKYFEELIRRFPDSKYTKDATQKLLLIKTILAGKDMHIAMYYLEQKKYLAALNRYKKVIDNYETNRYTPEALHRIVEIYFTLGMKDDAERIAAILGHNYPDSIWYKRTYSIVGDVNEIAEEGEGWTKKLFKKVF